jgi:hypothetical protein
MSGRAVCIDAAISRPSSGFSLLSHTDLLTIRLFINKVGEAGLDRAAA